MKGKGIRGEGAKLRCRLLSQHGRFRELSELVRLEGGVMGKGPEIQAGTIR